MNSLQFETALKELHTLARCAIEMSEPALTALRKANPAKDTPGDAAMIQLWPPNKRDLARWIEYAAAVQKFRNVSKAHLDWLGKS